jgi:dihydropteroate synthase
MERRHFVWKLAGRELLLGERTLLMGVLNVTPDSFSDGGKYFDPDRAFARAIQIEDEGADIVDIGAESTRPGSERISEAEELRRLIPVLKRLRQKLSIPISVDTYKSAVAEKAIEHGAEIVNEPSSLTFDPQMAHVVGQRDAGLVLNHMRGTPETWAKLPPLKDVMGSILADLDACVHRAVRAGVDRSRIVVDPGLGFGKRKEQNSEILARLPQLAQLDLPILIGPSRKSFLATSDKAPPPASIDYATAAAVALSILGGAHIVRVHEVADLKAALQVADQTLSYAGTSDNNAFRAAPQRSGGSEFRR